MRFPMVKISYVFYLATTHKLRFVDWALAVDWGKVDWKKQLTPNN